MPSSALKNTTAGLQAKIRRLPDLGHQYHLAGSLHAPTDALRTQSVPTNEKTVLCVFFNDTATTEIYTLSLHDALPICILPADLGQTAGQFGVNKRTDER